MRASSAARRSGVSKLPPSISREPDHVGERACGGEHIFDRAAAAAAREVIRVLPFRQQRKAQTLSGL